MDTDYKEIELYETKLRVYRDGTIWRLCKGGGGKECKKGEWKMSNPTYTKDGYIRITVRNINKIKRFLAHRIVGYAYLGLDIDDTTKQIDHKNRIRNDNRVENLDIVNNYQNNVNKDYSNCSGVEMRGDKYRALIQRNNKKIYLGTFNTWEEAHNIYIKAQKNIII